jgi:hypothetical protein
MALELIVSVAQQDSCATLVITDTTGEYNATSNPTGWGTAGAGWGGNIPIDNNQMEVAYLELTPPGSSTAINVDLMNTAIWQAITPYTTGIPWDSSVSPGTLSFTLTSDILGTSIIDGIWRIKYYVATAEVPSIVALYEFYIGFYCNVECCVESLLAAIPEHYNCDNCDNTYIRDVMTAKALLEALKLAACGAQTTRFNAIQETLSNLCEILGGNCSNC